MQLITKRSVGALVVILGTGGVVPVVAEAAPPATPAPRTVTKPGDTAPVIKGEVRRLPDK